MKECIEDRLKRLSNMGRKAPESNVGRFSQDLYANVSGSQNKNPREAHTGELHKSIAQNKFLWENFGGGEE